MDISKKEKWYEEIIRETEHYYLGEQRQEERSSWLLATASGLIILIVTSFFGNNNIPRWIILFQSIFYMGSIIFAIMGLLPYKGTKGIQGIFRKKESKKELMNQNCISFSSSLLHIEDNWSDESFENRVMHHLKSHYIRNLQKSKKVIISALFLTIGILFSLLTFCFF